MMTESSTRQEMNNLSTDYEQTAAGEEEVRRSLTDWCSDERLIRGEEARAHTHKHTHIHVSPHISNRVLSVLDHKARNTMTVQ